MCSQRTGVVLRAALIGILLPCCTARGAEAVLQPPKEVALKMVGEHGVPPNAEDLGRIREEMKARGLKVGALSVA